MNKILLLVIICCFSNLNCFSQTNDFHDNRFLIVLDVQNYTTINKLSETSSQQYIEVVNDIIGNFNSENVIYIQSLHLELNLSLLMPYLHITPDIFGMQIDKRMNLVNQHIFMNENSSAFSIKKLNKHLQQKKAKNIVIIGVLAENLVAETLIEGQEKGYEMFMIPEAIIGESEESKDKAIKELTEKGIRILDFH